MYPFLKYFIISHGNFIKYFSWEVLEGEMVKYLFSWLYEVCCLIQYKELNVMIILFLKDKLYLCLDWLYNQNSI